MAAKYILVKWSDGQYSTQNVKDVVFKKLEAGSSISRQVKNQMWEGVIDSVWGKFECGKI